MLSKGSGPVPDLDPGSSLRSEPDPGQLLCLYIPPPSVDITYSLETNIYLRGIKVYRTNTLAARMVLNGLVV